MPESDTFRLACVGTFPPRRCGIATFTQDLCEALCHELGHRNGVQVIAMNDRDEGYRYPDLVRFEIRQEQPNDYRLAADFINTRSVDLLLIQHEYGIFGGSAGRHLLTMLRDVTMPVVTTMHTVVTNPDRDFREATQCLLDLSDGIVVMSERAVEMLISMYDIARDRISVIPHGIPDVPFVDPAFHKDQFGVEGRRVLLTFGLLSPGKGIEYVIRALPDLVEDFPDLTYIILGATHPNVRKARGEEYRHELQRLAEELGVSDHVIFQNRYVELSELCDFLGAADIYVTPYLSEQQIASGTLCYALGCGKAVVSTPYWCAAEMLSDGRGRIVPFRDSRAIASEIRWLLEHENERQAMRKHAYLASRDAVWSQVAQAYLEVFHDVCEQPFVERLRDQCEAVSSTSTLYAVPEIEISHVSTLTDNVGILQHARLTIPDRRHGYCTDDNARALIFALDAYRITPRTELAKMARIYLAFLEHAYNDETSRFRNFMSYERKWLETVGSEDSHARSLWALGFTVCNALDSGMRAAAMHLFDRAVHACEGFQSPRSWAFALVGIHEYLRRYSGDSNVRRIRETLAQQLLAAFVHNGTEEWPWPEDKLTYSNGKLPHALLLSGRWMQNKKMIEEGIASLRWLMNVKTDVNGHLAPVGNNGWYQRGHIMARYDQQPEEAHALIEACIEAWHITRDQHWISESRRCLEWFLGKNSLKKSLYDYETGGCRDGLHSSGVNENQGAESTLAWLLSLTAAHRLQGASTGIFPIRGKQAEFAKTATL